MTSDLDTYHARMLEAQRAGVREQYDIACEWTIRAQKTARYTRTGTRRNDDAWQLRKWWATSCWIAAQKLAGGYADDYDTQETAR